MPAAKYAHDVFFESEQDTVVTNPEPKRAGHVAVKRVHIGGASLCETENSFKQTHGDGLVDGADVGLGFIEPLDAVRRHLPSIFRRSRSIFGLEPEPGKHILHRDAFAAALREPRLASLKTSPILFCHGLVVGRRRGHGTGYRIEQHELQEADRCRNLRVRKPFANTGTDGTNPALIASRSHNAQVTENLSARLLSSQRPRPFHP